MTTAARTLQLGRISLPAFDESDLENQLGSTLNPVGGAVPAGDRKPKGFTMDILVHGDPHDTNPYTTGLLMRKQLQSLFQNHPYRSAPVYVQSSVDPELNGWYMLGEAALDWADGGSTFNEYTLKISQAYIVGRQATHRPGLIARIPTPGDCFLDTLQTVSANPFPTTSYDMQPYIWLPPGATDVVGPDGTPATAIIGRPDGSNLYHDPNVNSELWAVSFELPETSVGAGDVVVYDRGGAVGPSPVTTFPTGWQEVYGPDWRWSHPLDIPAVCNGVCRIQATTVGGLSLSVDAQTAAGTWTRQGTITLGYSSPTIRSVTLLEWTPERAVVKAIITAGTSRAKMLITLQRGWSGPRVEAYDMAGAAVSVVWTPVPSAPRTDTAVVWGMQRFDSCSVTSGSATVTDSSIKASDHGRQLSVLGNLVGAVPSGNLYVGTVTPGVSFLLSTSATSQVNATATKTATDLVSFAGSGTVLDSSIQTSDQGRQIANNTDFATGGQMYVGTVTPGVSFLLSTSATSQVNATPNNEGSSVTLQGPNYATGTGWIQTGGVGTAVVATVQQSQAISASAGVATVNGAGYVSAQLETLLPSGYASYVFGWALQDCRPLQTLVERGY